MAKDTEFGLASYFYAHDLGRVWRVAERLEYAMVGVNTGLISNEVDPSVASSNRAWISRDRATGSKTNW